MHVSFEDFPEDEDDKLVKVEWEGGVVRLVTENHEHALDVASVSPDEVAEAQRILRKMNFDNRFQIEITQ